ncbi:MAG: tetratricopeptide repeat protein [Polyangiales bacterium]
MRFVLALTLSLAPATLFAQPAARPATTQPAARPAQPAATPAAPAAAANTHQPTPFDAAIMRGATAYHDHNLNAAATAFREAATANARSPLPQLYLGFVAQARGDAATALGAYREAARIAQAEGDDRNRARALAAIANVNESQNHWDDARNTWTEYATFADAHAQVAFPAVARARSETIGRRGTLETEYAPVRERIAERQRINASGANQQPPPGTAVAPVAPGTMPSGAVLPPR